MPDILRSLDGPVEGDPKLIERPEIIIVSKSELPDADVVAELLQESLGKPVRCVSAVTGKGLPDLISEILRTLTHIEEQDDPFPSQGIDG